MKKSFKYLALVSGFVHFFGQSAWADEKPLVVATTFTVIADMAKNIAGDDAQVVSMTKAGVDVHNYEPTPQDLAQVQQANLVLRNGMSFEPWFLSFFKDIKDVPAVVVGEGITPIAIEGGAYTGRANPHAWMSIDNAKIYVRNIESALARHDPEHAVDYKKRADAYIAQLEALGEALKARLAHIPEEQRWLVSSEGAFSYWAKDFGFKEAYLWAMNTDAQGTPQQVAQLIETVRQHQIPVVFSESTVSDAPAKQVALESGARYGGVLYVDSLSAEDGAVPTYLDLLRVNTETIAQGFEAAKP